MATTITFKGKLTKEAIKAAEVAKKSTSTSGTAFGRSFIKLMNSIIIL